MFYPVDLLELLRTATWAGTLWRGHYEKKKMLKIKILGSLRIVIKHENCALKKKGHKTKNHHQNNT